MKSAGVVGSPGTERETDTGRPRTRPPQRQGVLRAGVRSSNQTFYAKFLKRRLLIHPVVLGKSGHFPIL